MFCYWINNVVFDFQHNNNDVEEGGVMVAKVAPNTNGRQPGIRVHDKILKVRRLLKFFLIPVWQKETAWMVCYTDV